MRVLPINVQPVTTEIITIRPTPVPVAILTTTTRPMIRITRHYSFRRIVRPVTMKTHGPHRRLITMPNTSRSIPASTGANGISAAIVILRRVIMRYSLVSRVIPTRRPTTNTKGWVAMSTTALLVLPVTQQAQKPLILITVKPDFH